MLEFRNVPLGPSQAAMLQTAAVAAALRVAVESVQASVEAVEDKVDELMARARARDIGPIVGHHTVLTELTDTLDRDGQLPTTDWDTVAHLGANVPGAIETIRRYLTAQIDVLDGDASAPDRSRRLRGVVDGGQFAAMLRLLVVAEDSYYRWQRLRLEQVRVSEPDHLAGVTHRANAQLASDVERDTALVELLESRLGAYARQRPLERLNPLAAPDLERLAQVLHDELVAFAEARHVQLQEWTALSRPTLNDAVREIGTVTATSARQAVDAGGSRGRGGQGHCQ